MGIKISELPQASQLTSDDVVPIVQSGDTKKISIGNVISNSHNTNQANTYSSDYINNNFNKVNVQTSQTTSTTDTYSCNYIDNKIKNEYNTNTTEGYSSNYINNKIEELTTYSTEEKVIGKWIDGKPIYRIVFYLGNVAKAKQMITDLTNLHIKIVIRQDCIAQKNEGDYAWINLPDFYVYGQNSTSSSYYNANNATKNVYEILEYTKTTD